MNNQNKIKAKR